MGFALAKAALDRGAEVTIVKGITTVAPPTGVRIVEAVSAEEMAKAVEQERNAASVFIGAAAVADYRPAQREAQKIKKAQDSMTLVLERTPDILHQVSSARSDRLLVIGFAAETENLKANALEKLRTKRLDVIVGNDVSGNDSGFDAADNRITIISRDDDVAVELPLMSKVEAAHRILDVVVRLRSEKSISPAPAS
jgi:phosphopantothenoylcysteine decarboxylase/phosphopantothenate--cysteine ligase